VRQHEAGRAVNHAQVWPMDVFSNFPILFSRFTAVFGKHSDSIKSVALNLDQQGSIAHITMPHYLSHIEIRKSKTSR
jgi:hypothetical protein